MCTMYMGMFLRLAKVRVRFESRTKNVSISGWIHIFCFGSVSASPHAFLGIFALLCLFAEYLKCFQN